jgi:GNAT superfamily N-acetyltransferase
MHYRIVQADMRHDAAGLRALLTEYLVWANTRNWVEFGVCFDARAVVEHDLAALRAYSPPPGNLLLACQGRQPVGMGWMHRSAAGIAEIKRVYLRPAYRGYGLGRMLVGRLIEAAGRAGYGLIRLDSARYMKEAQCLYRSLGFVECEPYGESEIPPEYWKHWIFMQRRVEIEECTSRAGLDAAEIPHFSHS